MNAHAIEFDVRQAQRELKAFARTYPRYRPVQSRCRTLGQNLRLLEANPTDKHLLRGTYRNVQDLAAAVSSPEARVRRVGLAPPPVRRAYRRRIPGAAKRKGKVAAQSATLFHSIEDLIPREISGRADIVQMATVGILENRFALAALKDPNGAAFRSLVREYYRTNFERGGHAKSLDQPTRTGGQWHDFLEGPDRQDTGDES